MLKKYYLTQEVYLSGKFKVVFEITDPFSLLVWQVFCILNLFQNLLKCKR